MTTSAPAGDFDYEAHGASYASIRRPDSRIEAIVHAALGLSRTVLNVGAGGMADLVGVDSDRLLLWLFARCVQESPDRPLLAEVARQVAPT